MLNNVKLLSIIFLSALITIGFFMYRNDYQSILIFIVASIVIYTITKNMIVVLGLSILFVISLAFVKKINRNEGFEDDIVSGSESESDDENDYMQDKKIIKKIKKMNPKMLKTLNKLNSIDIKEVNDYINTLKDVIDP